ncbi:MAG: hypothetical protein AAF984_05340 [Verrucomicrobiota bacterium]
MKYLFLLLMLTLTTPVFAQTGSEFRTQTSKPEEKSFIQKTPEDISKPKATGIIVQMSEHGLEVINPMADTKLGYGEQNLSEGVETDGPIGNAQDRKPFHGLRLFGWLF